MKWRVGRSFAMATCLSFAACAVLFIRRRIVLLLFACAGTLQAQFGGGPYDSIGGRLSQGHANQTRWTTQWGKPSPPRLALLWFPSDMQAVEAEVHTNGLRRIRSTKVLREAANEAKLESTSFREAEAVLKSLPASSDGTEFARQIRVSWMDGAQWQTRVYDRGNPPPQLAALASAIGVRLPYICPALPEKFAGHSDAFPGALGFRAAPSDRGLLVVRDGQVLLIAPDNLSKPAIFPAPPLITNSAANSLYGVSVTPDATQAAYATTAAIVVHRLATGEELWRLPVPPPYVVTQAAISPDGTKVLVYERERLRLCSVLKQFEQKELAREERISSVVWNRGGTALAWSSDARVVLCDGMGERVHTISNAFPVTALAFSPDGLHLAIAFSVNWQIEVYDVASRQREFTVSAEVDNLDLLNSPGRLAWSPDGKRLAVAGDPGPLVICDVSRRRPIAHLPRTTVSPLVFRNDGRSVMASGMDNAMHVWDLEQLDRKAGAAY